MAEDFRLSRLLNGIHTRSTRRSTLVFCIFQMASGAGPLACFGESFINDVESSVITGIPRIEWTSAIAMYFYQRGFRLCLERSAEYFSTLLEASPMVVGEVIMRSIPAIERFHGVSAALDLHELAQTSLEAYPSALQSLKTHWQESPMRYFDLVSALSKRCPLLPAFEVIEPPELYSNRPFGCSMRASSVGHVVAHLKLASVVRNHFQSPVKLFPLYFECLSFFRGYTEHELREILNRYLQCPTRESRCVTILPFIWADWAPSEFIIIVPTETASIYRNGRIIFFPFNRNFTPSSVLSLLCKCWCCVPPYPH